MSADVPSATVAFSTVVADGSVVPQAVAAKKDTAERAAIRASLPRRWREVAGIMGLLLGQ